MKTATLWQDDQGTALMEFVLVMPILVFMIFCIAQLALVCMAKQLTHYAAYSAARAVIVYHPDDFSDNGVFYSDKGVAHQAACTVLAWLAHLPGGPDKMQIPDWGEIPGSGYIREQVAIDPANSVILTDVPAVKVTVKFRYPLLIPFAGNIIGYFHGGKAEGNWDVVGLLPKDMPEKLAPNKVADTPCFMLTETCILPMPWDNNMFPRAETTAALGTEEIQ